MGSNDIIRLPNGRTATRSRALKMGWLDAKGNLTAKAPQSHRDVVAQQRAERSAQWRRSQGLPAPERGQDAAEAAASAALAGKRKRIEPLLPKNVTATGEEITDPETLAEIEERTRAIEAAKAAQS